MNENGLQRSDAPQRFLVEKDVEIPLRDGTVTRANVYRPEGDSPVPAILARTPYCKDIALVYDCTVDPIRAAERGYAVVYQDTRGRHASDGDFYPYRHEREDGYDTVEWVAGQPWCDGSVGMTGLSYLGAVQWLAAIERPPHLKTIIPITIGSTNSIDMMAFKGGAFKLGYLLWWGALFVGSETARRRVLAGEADDGEVLRIIEGADRHEEQVSHLPLSTLPLLRENPVADFYFDWMERRRQPWDDGPADHYGEIEVPALGISGWYDYFLDGTLENFVRMREEAPTEAAREGQRLLIGPWDHQVGSISSEWDFGTLASRAGADVDGYQLDHFDRHLRGATENAGELPRVRIYVMGEDVWRDEEEWPLARAEEEQWFFCGDGGGVDGGGLTRAAPGSEPPDPYLYDPRHPAPTLGGAVGLPGLLQGVNVGPRDQRPIEARADALVYTSELLRQPIEVTGPIRAVLHAASSAPDTDFIVRLCDVHPDGASRLLTEGIVRARYRDGYDQPSLLEPDAVVAYEIDMVATSNVFLPGHRIRVDITSSSVPYFDRNPNTGNALGSDGPEDLTVALQRIFHDAQRPSHVVLPVIPR